MERLYPAAPNTVDPTTLRPGDVVYDEPWIEISGEQTLTSDDVETGIVVVADRDGVLYGMYLRGGVHVCDDAPHGILHRLDVHERLFATQSEALLAQARRERLEAESCIRLAEQLESLAAELKSNQAHTVRTVRRLRLRRG